MKKYASVVLDTSIDKTLDYMIPEELLPSAKPGVRVEIPVRGSKTTGTILSLKDESEFPTFSPFQDYSPTESPPLNSLSWPYSFRNTTYHPCKKYSEP